MAETNPPRDPDAEFLLELALDKRLGKHEPDRLRRIASRLDEMEAEITRLRNVTKGEIADAVELATGAAGRTSTVPNDTSGSKAPAPGSEPGPANPWWIYNQVAPFGMSETKTGRRCRFEVLYRELQDRALEEEGE